MKVVWQPLWWTAADASHCCNGSSSALHWAPFFRSWTCHVSWCDRFDMVWFLHVSSQDWTVCSSEPSPFGWWMAQEKKHPRDHERRLAERVEEPRNDIVTLLLIVTYCYIINYWYCSLVISMLFCGDVDLAPLSWNLSFEAVVDVKAWLLNHFEHTARSMSMICKYQCSSVGVGFTMVYLQD